MGKRSNKLDKPPLPENQQITVDVYFGVFFDGTSNNKDQASIGETYREYSLQLNKKELKEKAKEIGYTGNRMQKKDKSNVALLFPYIDEVSKEYICKPIYIEGIGTGDDGDSSIRGELIGTGDLGVEAKVEKAIKRLPQRIKKSLAKCSGANLNLFFEIFGFSRGSAAARNFVWKVQKGENALKEKLKKNNFNLMPPIKFNYVGLFDTVSQYGILGASDEKLNLDAIKHPNVNKVFHICAGNEFRFIMPLTNIISATNAGHGEEIFIPGNHSDIGGGHAGGKYSFISMGLMHKNANSERNKMFISLKTEHSIPDELKNVYADINSKSALSVSLETCQILFSDHYDDIKKWSNCEKSGTRTIHNG
ncbi:MAG: DUF2235 domain-containing protein [Bacteroidales bacterium]|jgi:hypothetical protein|nr:DUF2235 domain-containing protein [Bacteroidales bacterium]